MMTGLHHPWAVVAFGISGNALSLMVLLAPVPMLYRICKKRSTEGFQAVPYVIALSSAMLMMYYALVKKTNSTLLLTINGIGCFIQTLYIVLFLVFAPRQARISTAKLLLLLNVVAYGIIVGTTFFLLTGSTRVRVVGWINVGFSISVFAAPLSVMRRVIRTRSVEFMPFGLSFFFTASAVVWFSHGFLTRDAFVAAPNILGFLSGVAQMVLYVIYRDAAKQPNGHPDKDPEKGAAADDGEHPEQLVAINISATAGSGVHTIEANEAVLGEEDIEEGQPLPDGATVLGEEESAAPAVVEVGLRRA